MKNILCLKVVAIYEKCISMKAILKNSVQLLFCQFSENKKIGDKNHYNQWDKL